MSIPDARRRVLKAAAGALSLWALPGHVVAAPRRVEAFDAQAWKALHAAVKKPTVVVFTATWCAHCPAVFEQLADAQKQGRLKADLLAVVMDRAPGEDDAALLANAHYRRLARLFAFEGQAAALRHGVDPGWRGVTPFIGVLAPGRPPRLHVGPPGEADLADWSRWKP